MNDAKPRSGLFSVEMTAYRARTETQRLKNQLRSSPVLENFAGVEFLDDAIRVLSSIERGLAKLQESEP